MRVKISRKSAKVFKIFDYHFDCRFIKIKILHRLSIFGVVLLYLCGDERSVLVVGVICAVLAVKSLCGVCGEQRIDRLARRRGQGSGVAFEKLAESFLRIVYEIIERVYLPLTCLLYTSPSPRDRG